MHILYYTLLVSICFSKLGFLVTETLEFVGSATWNKIGPTGLSDAKYASHRLGLAHVGTLHHSVRKPELNCRVPTSDICSAIIYYSNSRVYC